MQAQTVASGLDRIPCMGRDRQDAVLSRDPGSREDNPHISCGRLSPHQIPE